MFVAHKPGVSPIFLQTPREATWLRIFPCVTPLPSILMSTRTSNPSSRLPRPVGGFLTPLQSNAPSVFACIGRGWTVSLVLALSLTACEKPDGLPGTTGDGNDPSTTETSVDTTTSGAPSSTTGSGDASTSSADNTGDATTTGESTPTTSSDNATSSSNAPTSTDATTSGDSTTSSDHTTSGDNTTTDDNPTTSDGGSTEESGLDPEDPRLRVVVREEVELCGQCRGYVSHFYSAFNTKQRVRIHPGTYELDDVKLSGEVLHEGKSYPFSSPGFAMSTFKTSDSRLITSVREGAAQWEDGSPLEISLGLSNARSPHNPLEFVIDSFAQAESTLDFKRLEFSAPEPAVGLGNSMARIFDACELEGGRKDVFRFEFEGGDQVAFNAHSKHLAFGFPAQAGRTLSATGTLDGQDFAVDDDENLLYCNRSEAKSLRMPELAVRFPEHNGICGIGMRPLRKFDKKIPYKAELLDCELKKVREIKIVAVDLPSGFNPQ